MDCSLPPAILELVVTLQDPSAFLQNPLRCYFGDGNGALWNFIENGFTGDEVLNIIRNLVAPIGARAITDLLVPRALMKVVRALRVASDVTDKFTPS